MKTSGLMTAFWLALFVFCVSPPARSQSPLASASTDTQRYTMLMMEKPAGAQVSTLLPGGERHATFEFNDRGRGPKLSETIMAGADSIPTKIEITGVDYLKSPVAERFSFENGRAVWTSHAEHGEKQVNGKAFYVSMSGVPEEVALLAQALLKTPGGRLALLPDGEARIERLGELRVESGGKSLTVVEYAISGLGFTPSPIWLDEAGSFFASASGWATVIREGWESTVPALVKAQDVAEATQAAAMAKALAHHPAGALVFTNANLFDAETATMRPQTTVLIAGNRIREVGPTDSVKVPEGAEVIDASGKTLMPGLWDMHVHLGDIDGLLHLAAGVTTVRDLGNDSDRLLEMKSKFDAGTTIGPHVLMAGLIDGRGPYAGPTKVFVDNEQEARAAIDKYASRGYVQIKIYSSIKPELVPGIIEFGHARGMRVSGHVPAFMTAEQFVKAGADEIQHTNFLFLNFLFDTVKDTRTPVRFTAVAEHAAELDLRSERVVRFLQLLKDRKTVVDPTLVAFEGMFTARPGSVTPEFAAVADRLPPQVRRGMLGGGLPVPEGKDQRYRDSFDALLKMVRALYEAGIPVVAGTDSLAGFSLPRELELYVQAGIPAPKVLQLATLGAARVMKRDRESGSILPGKMADLILVDGDPASRIGDIRHVRVIVKDGTVYRSAALYDKIGVRP